MITGITRRPRGLVQIRQSSPSGQEAPQPVRTSTRFQSATKPFVVNQSHAPRRATEFAQRTVFAPNDVSERSLSPALLLGMNLARYSGKLPFWLFPVQHRLGLSDRVCKRGGLTVRVRGAWTRKDHVCD